MADILEIDAATIPAENSWAYDQIIEGILRGEDQGPVGGLHEPGPFVDQPEHLLATYLDRLDFLVVQDMYHTTETAQLADLVLPAAGWGEKEGTFINSERRFGAAQESRPRAGPGARRLLTSSG